MGRCPGCATPGTLPRMNYFEYFSEIEERFVARRGSLLLLSTLDWALIETWREAGIPLAAVLRGIDCAFDRYDERKARSRGKLARVNGLAWCAQAVMEAATELAEAAVGAQAATKAAAGTGFETGRVAGYLEGNAAVLKAAQDRAPGGLQEMLQASAARLCELAGEVRNGKQPPLDELDRTLTVLEERLLAALVASAPEAELVSLREIADRELTPYRARLGAVQGRQVREQFVQKRLLEARGLPRLSLFYMPLADEAATTGAAGAAVPPGVAAQHGGGPGAGA
jgi:hypothetical protein